MLPPVDPPLVVPLPPDVLPDPLEDVLVELLDDVLLELLDDVLVELLDEVPPDPVAEPPELLATDVVAPDPEPDPDPPLPPDCARLLPVPDDRSSHASRSTSPLFGLMTISRRPSAASATIRTRPSHVRSVEMERNPSSCNCCTMAVSYPCASAGPIPTAPATIATMTVRAIIIHPL